MFCSQCGQEIPDGSKFCPKCGGKMMPAGKEPEQVSPAPDVAEQAESQATSGNTQAPAAKKGGAGKAIMIAVIAVVVVVVCAIAAFVVAPMATGGKKTADLSQYYTITTEGYDTIGKASYERNIDQFVDDYEDSFELTAKDIKKAAKNNSDIEEMVMWLGGYEAVANYYSGEELARTVMSCYSGELSQTEGLSNGDEVTLSFDVAEDDLAEIEELLGYRFELEDITTTVENLAEIQTFDPFEGVTLEFEGINEDGTATLDTTGVDEACRDLVYIVEPQEGLSNGDTVTVTVDSRYDDNWEESLVENYGKAPAATTKDYTVEGLGEYITSASQISDDALEEIKAQTETIFEDDVVADYDPNDQELVGLEYAGYYFLNAKDGIATNYKNQLYVVYKVQTHVWLSKNDKSCDEIEEYYTYYRYTDLIVTDDGAIHVDYEDYAACDNEYFYESGINNWLGRYGWYIDGYESLDELYNELITVNVGNYEEEVAIEGIDAESAADADEETDDAEDADTEETVEETAEESADEASTEETVAEESGDDTAEETTEE